MERLDERHGTGEPEHITTSSDKREIRDLDSILQEAGGKDLGGD